MANDKMTPATFLLTLRLARMFYAADKAEVEAADAFDAANGHRSHYCIHGTNQWTDYDNICGGCEDGVTLRQMSVERAYGVTSRFYKALDLAREAGAQHFPREVTDAMWEHACNILTPYFPKA